ncbi:MAG TPA: hypothetical protein VJN94_02585, partial [Candidatus Binataceae bacterium]|nr:hypothetical protein [Candidatus Binataceae bacterium]
MFVIVFAAPQLLFASVVRIPLKIDYLMLTEALRQQLYQHGGQAQLWNGDNACQYFYTENPSFAAHQGALQLDTDGTLSLGMPMGEKCLSRLAWSGIVESDTIPYIAGLALKLRVTDVNLYDRSHHKSLLVGRGFDLIKSNLIPALQTFSFDLSPAIHELAGLGQMAAAPADAAQVRQALATMRLDSAVMVEDNGIHLTLIIDVPASAAMVPLAASSAPLKPEEVAAWNTALNNWDAFLVFAVKQIGVTVPDPQVRAALFEILIDSRERLVEALEQPQRLAGPDPVRVLFLDEWTHLHDVVEAAAAEGKLGNRALEFVSFISAGDALFALDQAAPALGVHITADDLRRLARIMAPKASGDPLAYSFAEDPQLRQIFGVTSPLETPGELEPAGPPPENPMGGANPGPAAAASSPEQSGGSPAPTAAESGNGASSTPAATPAPATAAPSDSAEPPPSPASSPLSMLSNVIAPAEAYGAEAVPGSRQSTQLILELGRKLRDVVVNPQNADAYRQEIEQLLNLSARHQVDAGPLDGPARIAWPLLIKAAAWQESCWR